MYETRQNKVPPSRRICNSAAISIRVCNPMPLSEARLRGMQSETKINELRAAHEVETLI